MLWYVKISIVEGKEIVIVNVRNLTDFGCPLRSTWDKGNTTKCLFLFPFCLYIETIDNFTHI